METRAKKTAATTASRRLLRRRVRNRRHSCRASRASGRSVWALRSVGDSSPILQLQLLTSLTIVRSRGKKPDARVRVEDSSCAPAVIVTASNQSNGIKVMSASHGRPG